ncbi:MAG: NAD-dependent epimerase/dehydratase family protein [Treponema sp.]|jgi:nucleoside-diphosphate-sugar epimerase|nr:NAD-dependent epimerase/dehydratase family protein [Treponema sp.]
MKVLFIGGTGTISAAISRRVLRLGWDLYLLNRGNRNRDLAEEPFRGAAGDGELPPASGKLVEIACDINAESEKEIASKLSGVLDAGERFDAAADFIAFTLPQVERDYRLLEGLVKQYIFISSASAYQKPLSSCFVTEGTPLANPYWEYSRNKIACEDFLAAKYRESAFPVTIVRPAHTYDERSVPLGIHGKNGSWQVLKRMLDGKPVIIHGDGESLWTMTANYDFAKAFTGLTGNIHAIGEAVQITSGETVTWNQIYAAIADALGVPLKAVHISSEFLSAAGHWDFTGSIIGDKANSVVFDNTKLKRLVPGFTASVRFDAGVKEAVKYILAHRECRVEDPEFDAWCDRVIAARERALDELRR